MKIKNKGSAIIISVLLLSFFLSLSLNIYFVAMKKGEAAGIKVEGENITNRIDTASSLGYQELFIAENFVRLGFPYKGSHSGIINTYSVPSSDDSYFNPIEGKYESGEKYSGVQLTDLLDYFTAHWDYEEGGVEHQKLVMSEDVNGDVVESRMWQSGGVPEKAIPLWSMTGASTDTEKVSIGGYHLTQLEVGSNAPLDIDFSSNPQEIIEDNVEVGTESIIATYTKFITLEEDGTLEIPEMKFKFEIKESFFSEKGSTSDDFEDLNFYGRKISKFTVKYIEE